MKNNLKVHNLSRTDAILITIEDVIKKTHKTINNSHGAVPYIIPTSTTYTLDSLTGGVKKCSIFLEGNVENDNTIQSALWEGIIPTSGTIEIDPHLKIVTHNDLMLVNLLTVPVVNDKTIKSDYTYYIILLVILLILLIILYFTKK
jgi:hypothetical protein